MAICNLISVILLTTIVILVQSVCASSSYYYPDLSTQDGSSCAEKTVFATTRDPFYDWITGSYLVTGFETDDSISIQEAGLAYKKLSAWRVTSSNSTPALMFNSPEPHVVGGSFYQNPHNRIARMTVHWGLSIRICNGGIFFADKGQNMCRYTRQIMPALLQDGSISFHSLLSEIKYSNSDLIHLTNWVSNARTPGAVGVNRTVISRTPNFWYYSNPQLALNCSRLPIYYRADMTAYLGESYVGCACVGNVCAQDVDLTVSSGEFQGAGPCKRVNSYWVPLEDGVYLYTYSPEIDRYYVLNSTFDTTTFPDNISKADLDGMGDLSSCLEDWLASNTNPSPDVQSLATACPSNLTVDYTYDYDHDMIISYSVGLASKSVKKALESGDDCQANFNVEKVCSSNTLEDEEVQDIKNIVGNFSQLQEVRNYAHNQWASMASKRHDAYLDIVAAFLAIFVTNGVVFSNKLVDLEKWLYNNCVCAHGGGKASIQSQLWKKVIFFVRWIARFGPLGGIVFHFMFSMWNTFKDLEAGPSNAWILTIEQQPRNDTAYLVTTTSTIQVQPRWSTCYVLVGMAIVYFILSFFLTFREVGEHPVDDGAPRRRRPTRVDDEAPQDHPRIP